MQIETSIVNGKFVVTRKDGEKVKDSEIYEGEKALDVKGTAQAITAVVRNAGSARRAWMSFLAIVWANPKLDGYRGTGNKAEGKLSKELKASVRTAEENTVDQLVKDGHLKLPAGMKGEEGLQAYLSTLRDDKNYSNAKNLVNRFMAFVGENFADGGVLMPAPYMQARVKQVLDAEAKPDTLPPIAKLLAEAETKFNDMEIGADDVYASLPILRRMLSSMEGIATTMAAKATEVKGNVNVTAAMKEVVTTAQQEPAKVE